MSAYFTTDNIELLRAVPHADTGKWQISFRSRNAGMHHQLYLNGRMVDWTDTPGERMFYADFDSAPRRVVVAAVPPRYRRLEISGLSGDEFQPTGWIYRLMLVPDIASGGDDRFAIFDDHATGQFSTTPDLVVDAWPGWARRWAWGEDSFALGGFGYDGWSAAGMGLGGFAAGMFGFNMHLVKVALAMSEPGQHQVRIRTICPDGQFADAGLQQFDACPPPAPSSDLAVESYDAQKHTLTLTWTKSPSDA